MHFVECTCQRCLQCRLARRKAAKSGMKHVSASLGNMQARLGATSGAMLKGKKATYAAEKKAKKAHKKDDGDEEEDAMDDDDN